MLPFYIRMYQIWALQFFKQVNVMKTRPIFPCFLFKHSLFSTEENSVVCYTIEITGLVQRIQLLGHNISSECNIILWYLELIVKHRN